MTDSTIIPVTSLLSNIVYADLSNPNCPEHFKWRKPGETHNMTFRQLRNMFAQYPAYKEWLCPAPQALEPLGLTMEHYDKLRAKYRKMRRYRG